MQACELRDEARDLDPSIRISVGQATRYIESFEPQRATGRRFEPQNIDGCLQMARTREAERLAGLGQNPTPGNVSNWNVYNHTFTPIQCICRGRGWVCTKVPSLAWYTPNNGCKPGIPKHCNRWHKACPRCSHSRRRRLLPAYIERMDMPTFHGIWDAMEQFHETNNKKMQAFELQDAVRNLVPRIDISMGVATKCVRDFHRLRRSAPRVEQKESEEEPVTPQAPAPAAAGIVCRGCNATLSSGSDTVCGHCYETYCGSCIRSSNHHSTNSGCSNNQTAEYLLFEQRRNTRRRLADAPQSLQDAMEAHYDANRGGLQEPHELIIEAAGLEVPLVVSQKQAFEWLKAFPARRERENMARIAAARLERELAAQRERDNEILRRAGIDNLSIEELQEHNRDYRLTNSRADGYAVQKLHDKLEQRRRARQPCEMCNGTHEVLKTKTTHAGLPCIFTGWHGVTHTCMTRCFRCDVLGLPPLASQGNDLPDRSEYPF